MQDLPDKALSVRQPWAWAIIHAGKRLENRTAHAISLGGMKPGFICIHASKGMTREEYEDGKDFIERARSEISFGFAITNVPRPDELIRGAIIGVVRVTGIAKESDSPWWIGPRALILDNTKAVDPIPVGGDLGYFDWKKNTGQSWSAKAIQAPLPWMISWPERPKAQRAARSPMAAPASLFEE